MPFVFAPAKRENEPIKLGIGGPSRSGKSKSALRVAVGMAGGDPSKVFAVNTERGGITIYADEFPGFMCAPLGPPFSFTRYKEAIAAARDAGAKVIIIDSASHAHEGEGGMLDQFEAELERMSKGDAGKREAVKFAAWIKPKAASNDFVQFVMQLNVHTIWCFRAKEKLKLVRTGGSIKPMPQGYQPIITDGFEYEMHSLIMLGENSKGVPDLEAQAMGLRDPVDRFLRGNPGQPLDESFGEALAKWAAGGAKVKKDTPAATPAPARAETPASAPQNEKPEQSEAETKGDLLGPQPEWIWIAPNGDTRDAGSREEWLERIGNMVMRTASADTLKAASERNVNVLAALAKAGQIDAAETINSMIAQRIGELEGQL